MWGHTIGIQGQTGQLTGAMMDPLLLLPDFPLILGGFCLRRHTALGRPTWDMVERLVYPLLVAAPLFTPVARSLLQPGDAAQLNAGDGGAHRGDGTHVLAMRMGGNGPLVAELITASTLLGMGTVPLWIGTLT